MTDDPMKFDKLPADDIFVADGAAGQQIPIWTVDKDASLEALPLSAGAARLDRRRRLQGHGQAADAAARPRRPRCRRPFRLGRRRGRRAVGTVRAADRPAGAIAADRQLSAGERGAQPDPRRHRLGPRGLSLPRYKSSTHAACGEPAPARGRRPRSGAQHHRGGVAAAATSSTRRPPTSARPRSRRPRASSPRGTARDIDVIVGDDLLAQEFPDDPRRRPRQPARAAPHRSHAGAARARAPSRWSARASPSTPAASTSSRRARMLLMKKDMGGAAAALALGHMIMAQKLDVRLRILIPTAENSISGNAFRPGDVLHIARRQDGRDRQHRCRGPPRACRRHGACRRGERRTACSCSPR